MTDPTPTDPETPTARALLEALQAISAHISTGIGKGMLAATEWRDALIEAGAMLDDVFNDHGDTFDALLAADEGRADEARVAEGLTVEALAVALHRAAPKNHAPGPLIRSICQGSDAHLTHAAAILANLPAPRSPEPDRDSYWFYGPGAPKENFTARPPEPDRAAAVEERLAARQCEASAWYDLPDDGVSRCMDPEYNEEEPAICAPCEARAALATPEPAPVADGTCQFTMDDWTCLRPASDPNHEDRFEHGTMASHRFLPAPRPPEPDRGLMEAALRRWLRDDPWVPSAWSGTKVIQWECYACEATITLPPRPLSLTGPDEAWHIDGTGREERCLWLVTREALSRPPEPDDDDHEHDNYGDPVMQAEARQRDFIPRPPEPDRTAALARDADHDWTTARMAIAEFETRVAALVEALEDARKTIVVQHGGHYGCADGDCYVRDTLDRIAPLLAPEPPPVADGTVEG